MATQLATRPLTVAEFEQWLESTELPDGVRYELIDGEIVRMSPIGDRHAACVRRLNRLFIMHLQNNAVVDPQNALRLPALRSRFQPDLMVLRWRDDDYAAVTPTPADVLLVVEV